MLDKIIMGTLQLMCGWFAFATFLILTDDQPKRLQCPADQIEVIRWSRTLENQLIQRRICTEPIPGVIIWTKDSKGNPVRMQ